jgi:purine nucleosidase
MNVEIIAKMKKVFPFLLIVLLIFTFICCQKSEVKSERKIRVIFDTDTNNELDDQHALAYLLFNQDQFKIEGITINATSSGGNIDKQYEEAKRVLQLCAADTLPVLKGADRSYPEIFPTLDSVAYDGKEAVDRMIEKAHKPAEDKLVILAVGKLTTVALAVAKDSSFAKRVRLVWLGSNYPEPGEHNQNNDTVAMNLLLNSAIDFEMVTVRYGKPSGTDAVQITQQEVNTLMPGLGPHISTPVTGRHGGEFYCFGDYSINLFEHIDYHGDPPARALFDMAAVAIVKNPAWAQQRTIPAPIFINNQWAERPANSRTITVWENFKRKEIIEDFIASFPSQD